MRVPGHRSLERAIVEIEGSRFVAPEQPQIGVVALQLVRKRFADFPILHAGKAPFAGTEAEQNELIVLAALELERTPVRAIGNDGVSELGQGHRPTQPRGVTG
jgi:hypothetical protein